MVPTPHNLIQISPVSLQSTCVYLIVHKVIMCKFLYHTRQDTEQFLHHKDTFSCSLTLFFFASSSFLTRMLNKVLLSQILLFPLFLTNRQLSEKTGHIFVQYFLPELYVINLQLVSLLPTSSPSGLNAQVMVLKHKSNKVNFLIKTLTALWCLHDKISPAKPIRIRTILFF